MVTPCLLRFTKAAGADQKSVSADVQSLLGKWIGDPGAMKPPGAVPLKLTPEHYSLEFTVGELLDDPRTKALLDEYLPTLPRQGFVRAITLELLAKYRGGEEAAKICALGEALKKIPVDKE
jgi:hypothetical protein